MTTLGAIALTCSLKPHPAPSSSELIAGHVLAALRSHDVVGEQIRLVDRNISPGVSTDMGHGDEWPAIRERIKAADILVLAAPAWLGQMSSVAKRALERLDAEISNADD